MVHHLGGASHPNLPATKFILQPRIAAFLVPLRFGRVKRDLLAAARVVVDQRYVSQAAAVVANLFAAIGRIHQVIAVRHPALRHQCQRDQSLAIMHRGAGEQCARQGATIMRGSAHTTPDRGAGRGGSPRLATGLGPGPLNKFFDPHPFQRVDYLLQFRGQRPNLASQFGHQLTLVYSPALHYQTALRNIHGGRSCLFRQLASCQQWLRPPSLLRRFA